MGLLYISLIVFSILSSIGIAVLIWERMELKNKFFINSKGYYN